MRKNASLVCLILALVLIMGTVAFTAQPVGRDVAQRAAEYYAELTFQRDLKACACETMFWPWGEPAVYVYTLIREGDSYPPRILFDDTLHRGANLVAAGREEEGYLTMAQVDRYFTVFIGATTDMPSMIKAHAGLPEHILALALMPDPPSDARWIYAGPFHTLVVSERDFKPGAKKAVEIHTGQEAALKDLGLDKVGTVPAGAEALEWAPFFGPGGGPVELKNPYLWAGAGLEDGEYKLNVKELNTKGNWTGCSPAAFYNCLKYLESRGKVDTGHAGANFLLDYIAICFQTNPNGGVTAPSNMLSGAVQAFRGLGYNSACYEVGYNNKPLPFLIKFAAEIGRDMPCEVGGAGKGVFVGHSTTGIGYVKKGEQYQLIIHDGWKTTPAPVYVKYLGYPAKQLQWPESLTAFHPGAEMEFEKAEPVVNGPKEVGFTLAGRTWKFKLKFSSKNEVRVRAYAWQVTGYDVDGHKYRTEKPKQIYPQIKQGEEAELKFNYPAYKAGKVVIVFNIVDNNGNLFKATYTVTLLEQVVGKWKMTITWRGFAPYTTTWTLNKDNTFSSGTGGKGTWSLDNLAVKLVYTTPDYPIYVGTVNPVFTLMNGTASMTSHGKYYTGTWKATRNTTAAEEQEEKPQLGTPGPSPGDAGVVR